MTPGIYTIVAYRGDTLTRTFTILDSAGSPVNLSTAAVKMQVRSKPDSEVLLELTEGNGITVGGAGNNVISISKVCDISDCGSYHYDLQATFSATDVRTYVRGAFIVQKDITQ